MIEKSLTIRLDDMLILMALADASSALLTLRNA
jgi:hypothetical protein